MSKPHGTENTKPPTSDLNSVAIICSWCDCLTVITLAGHRQLPPDNPSLLSMVPTHCPWCGQRAPQPISPNPPATPPTT